MIRVVVDTNVIVSGLLTSEGLPATILDLVLQRRVRAAVSEPLLDELERVLRRPKFNFAPRKIRSFLILLKSRVQWVSPKKAVDVCGKDPSDNRLLECSEAAKAEFLITGDKAHFPACHKNTFVVNPREFWEIYLSRS